MSLSILPQHPRLESPAGSKPPVTARSSFVRISRERPVPENATPNHFKVLLCFSSLLQHEKSSHSLRKQRTLSPGLRPVGPWQSRAPAGREQPRGAQLGAGEVRSWGCSTARTRGTRHGRRAGTFTKKLNASRRKTAAASPPPRWCS